MKNEIQNNQINPIIFTPGLNQLYFIDHDHLNYLSLSKELSMTIKNKFTTNNSFINLMKH